MAQRQAPLHGLGIPRSAWPAVGPTSPQTFGIARVNTVIEVKSSNLQGGGIEKVLITLALFCTKVGYQRTIYLLFGSEVDNAAKRVRRIAEQLGDLPPIELWLRSKPCKEAMPSHLIQRTA